MSTISQFFENIKATTQSAIIKIGNRKMTAGKTGCCNNFSFMKHLLVNWSSCYIVSFVSIEGTHK